MNRVINIVMKGFKIQVVLLFLLCFAMVSVKGQDNSVITQFNNFNLGGFHEKVFVHTDKNSYLTDEVLWFKIYDINGVTNTPFRFSKVGYVELLDEDYQPVLRTKVALAKDNGAGSFLIPSSLPSGSYLLQAYTSWMKNYSPALFFSQFVHIENPAQDKRPDGQIDSPDYDVQICPEGGNLVSDIQSTIGIRVANHWGQGIDFKGYIIDENKDTLTSFQSLKFGIGRFVFTPSAKMQYQAVIRLNHGKEIRRPLPKIHNTGFVLHLEDEGDKVKIDVVASFESEQAYLVVHSHQAVQLAELLSLKNCHGQLIIDKHKLGDGISYITLFDKEKKPVCERLYFKYPDKKLDIAVKTDRNQYGTREKVSVNLHTSNSPGQALESTISISVYRINEQSGNDWKDIYSYIWLESELKGTVEHPSFYFKQRNKQVDSALDNLMLTQGWRRFHQDDALKDTTPPFKYIPELYGHVIQAVITDKRNRKPLKDALVYLSVLGKWPRVYGYKSDSLGAVYFESDKMYGRNLIALQSNISDSFQISVLSPYAEKFFNRSFPKKTVYKNSSDWSDNYYLWNRIQHVYNSDWQKRFIDRRLDSIPFFGKPSKTYILDNYVRFTKMEEVIREYVQEVSVRRKGNDFHLMTLNATAFEVPGATSLGTMFEDDPLVLVDGIPVFDINKVIAFDPLKVKKLDVLAKRFFQGPLEADGIINFTTYKGDLENFPLDPNTVILDYDGLQKQREFYSPVYEGESQKNSRRPDFRSLLFWSPEIHTDTLGNGVCSFYTSDLPGNYLMLINGITADGYCGSQVSTFIVNK